MKRILFYILMASILASGISCSKIEPEAFIERWTGPETKTAKRTLLVMCFV